MIKFLFFSVATENGGDNSELTLYIGLISSITMFITILIIVVFVVRRKGQQHGMYEHDMNGTGEWQLVFNKTRTRQYLFLK